MKIVVGGQMDRQTIASMLERLVDGKAEIIVKSDLDATLAIKMGQADYYVGACSTGAGGALGIATGLLGAAKCVSISTPAGVKSPEFIENAVNEGKQCFGFVNYDAEKVLPVLIPLLLNKK